MTRSGQCLPLSIANCFLKHVVFSLKIHDSVLQMEFPFIPTPSYLENKSQIKSNCRRV